jgi:hypothetical protein
MKKGVLNKFLLNEKVEVLSREELEILGGYNTECRRRSKNVIDLRPGAPEYPDIEIYNPFTDCYHYVTDPRNWF